MSRNVQKYYYAQEEQFLVFTMDDLYVRVEPRKVSISSVSDAKSAADAMERVNRLLTQAIESGKGKVA